MAYRSVRFSPDGNRLVWNIAGGAEPRWSRNVEVRYRTTDGVKTTRTPRYNLMLNGIPGWRGR